MSKGGLALTDSTNPTSASGPDPAINADDLGVVCEALDRAWSAVMLYEPGHAARTRALEEGAASVRGCAGPKVVLRVGPEGWRDDGGGVRGRVGGELARLLHRLDVVAVELALSLDAIRLERLFGVLARARVEAWRGAALEGEVRAGVGDEAAIVPLRTSALTMVESAAEGAPGGQGECGAGLTWLGLTDVVLSPAENIDSAANGLEGKLASVIAGATCHASVTREVGGLGHRLAEMPEAEREIVSARIAKWMGGLPSQTREALLAMNERDAAGKGKLLHALAGKLPIEQIISALEASGGSDANLNARHNLMLFSKLSSLAMDQSVDLQKRVLGALERIGAGREAGGGSGGGETMRAVEQLLQPNRADDFTPREYRERLHELSQGMLHAASRLKDPEELSVDSLRVRVGEVGAFLTTEIAAPAPSAGMMAHLGRAILPMLARGSIEALLVAARTAERWVADERATPEASAALALREQVLARETMHAALALAGRLEAARTPLLEMIGTLGAVGIDRVIQYVAACRKDAGAEVLAWAEELERWIGIVPRAWTSGDLVRLVKEGELGASAMLAVFRRASMTDQALAMDQLAVVDDAGARRRAFALWDAIGLRWSGARIRHAILDSDPEIAERGQARLARDATTAELCGMLRSLVLSVSSEEARLAQAVARVLERAPQDEEVRRALKAWRYSPVRLRAGLLRKARKGEAA